MAKCTEKKMRTYQYEVWTTEIPKSNAKKLIMKWFSDYKLVHILQCNAKMTLCLMKIYQRVEANSLVSTLAH